jgi:hypothetical protein
VGDDWGGIYMDWLSAGSQIEYAEISHAANPIFFYYPDGSAIRHSTIHHFRDLGVWIFGAFGAGVDVEWNLVQRDDTTSAGDNLGIDHGNLGILLEKSGPLLARGNTVILKGMNNNVGGAGIAIRNGTLWCQAAPSSADSVQVVQNRVVGPGKSAPVERPPILSRRERRQQLIDIFHRQVRSGALIAFGLDYDFVQPPAAAALTRSLIQNHSAAGAVDAPPHVQRLLDDIERNGPSEK